MEQNKLYRIFSEEELEREEKHRLLHDFRYIHWHTEAEKIVLDHEEYTKMSQFLKENGRPLDSNYKTLRLEWCGDLVYRFDLETRKRQPAMYVSKKKDDNSGYDYTIYYTELDSEKLERDSGPGTKGWNRLYELVRKRTGRSLIDIFGVIPVENGTTYLTKCVKSIKQMVWYNDIMKNRKLTHIYKGDLKSAFPSALCGTLPNATTAVEHEGRILPTKEFPFAFYIKSGHVAEYGRFDTHDFVKNRWYQKSMYSQEENAENRGDPWVSFDDIADDDEITVLMKAADVDITRDVEKMFWVKENGEDKKTRDWYKWMLNALIGFMRSEKANKKYYQGHIAAIAYCRTVATMLELTERLVEEKNTPIYFAIDCIIWIGKESTLTTTEKQLGNFMEEVKDAEGVICGQGQYYLEKEGQLVVAKHQGIVKKLYQSWNITSPTQFIQYLGKGSIIKEVFDPSINEFSYEEVLNI